MQNRPKGFGMSSESEMKKGSKYDSEHTLEIESWIEAQLGKKIFAGSDSHSFAEALKDGQVLCQLSQKFDLGPKKISTSNMPFKMMENIGNFLSAAEQLGVAKTDLFQTIDLYEQQNIPQVVNGLHAFAREVSAQGKTDIIFGSKPKKDPRAFTEEQLREGQKTIGLQGGQNLSKGKGQNFGKTRAIIDD